MHVCRSVMYTHCAYMLYTCIYLLKKKTGDREEAAQKELLQRGAETRLRRKGDWA